MKEDVSNGKNINLLWTGGWDSTFQLLQLLLIYRRQVTPFYLIDADRRSTGVEIQTMKRIKEHLFKEYPYTRELLKPVRFFSVEDISPDVEITEAYHSILKEKHIGSQYDWLARFCKENGLVNMQLSMQKHHSPDKAHFNIAELLLESTDHLQTTYYIDTKFKGTKEYILFHFFSFPLIKFTKLQMADVINKNAWNEIMEMTWFCHNPTCDMQPCGKCNPCIITINEGFEWRFPFSRRIVSYFYRKLVKPSKLFFKGIPDRFTIFLGIRRP